MEKLRVRSLFFLLALLFFFFFLACVVEVSEGKKRGVSIPDELDDVVDDEEDEAWKEWGRKKNKKTEEEFRPPPAFSKMDPAAVHAETTKRQAAGPTVGFVKLRPGVPRTKEDVPAIAVRWSSVLRAGATEVSFMAVDPTTLMFTMGRGRDVEELKEFVLDQHEAYEMKIGEQLFRRPGDPPLDRVVAEMLRRPKKDLNVPTMSLF